MNKEIKKIYRSLLQDIASDKLQALDILPRETDLAARFGTNRMNAQRAVNALAEHNIVTRKKRIGTTVNPRLDRDKIQELLKETNRSIHVLYSLTPHWIHWNEVSFAGLEGVVDAAGFSVTYCNIPTGGGRTEYKKLLNDISEAGASALVIFPDMEDSEFLSDNADLLLDFQMPIFMLNRSGAPMPLDMVSFVATNPLGDGIQVGTLLKKNKHHNILVLNEETGTSFWGKKRCEGINMAVKRGCAENPFSVKMFLGSDSGMRQAMEIIKESSKDIVVVAVNNFYAAKFIDLCNANKLVIPNDFQLISFDDNPMFRAYNLTSLGVPMREVGEVFGKMICDNSWIGDYKGKISVKLSSKLIVRGTLNPKII